jgi:hypothetical protein
MNMDKNELNPLLKKELEHLQDVPERGLQAGHAGRENYLAQVRSLKPRPVQTTRSAQNGHRRSWVLRLASVVAVLALALGSIGGTVYAAQASGPNDLLYGVKTLTEEIQVSLESDPQDRLDLFTQFSNRRLAEIQAQVDAGETVSEKALALLEKHTGSMLEEAAKMGEQGLSNALRQIQQNLQKQNQVMEEIGKEHPQGNPPGLVKAKEEVQSRLRQVENGINEPQGFQEQMQQEKSDQPGKGNGNGNSDSPADQDTGSDAGDEESMPGNGNGQGPGRNN